MFEQNTSNFSIKFKRLTAILALITLVLLLLCSCNITDKSEVNRNRSINAVNHRGYGDAPENTLSAFRMSKQMGFDMVECDIRFTKDNVAVLIHDKTVSRTSNGRGKVSNMTYSELLTLDFGSWKDEKYKDERIPTFEQFIGLCIELSLHPYVEIKNGATAEQVETLIDAVNDANIPVTWIARNVEYLSQIHKLRSSDRLGLLVDVVTAKAVQSMLQIDKRVCFIDANYLFLSNSKIRLCEREKMPLEIWTLDNRYTITHIDIYVSGITSNKLNAQDLFLQI